MRKIAQVLSSIERSLHERGLIFWNPALNLHLPVWPTTCT